MIKRNGAVLERPLNGKKNKNCRHHWLIEPALGPTSKGVCRLCGAEKLFLNVVEDPEPKSSLSRLFDTELDEEGGKDLPEDEDDK